VDQLRGVAILLVLLWHVFGINFHWVLPWASGVRDFGAYGYESVFGPPFLPWSGRRSALLRSQRFLHSLVLHAFGTFRDLLVFWQRFWRIYPVYVIA